MFLLLWKTYRRNAVQTVQGKQSEEGSGGANVHPKGSGCFFRFLKNRRSYYRCVHVCASAFGSRGVYVCSCGDGRLLGTKRMKNARSVDGAAILFSKLMCTTGAKELNICIHGRSKANSNCKVNQPLRSNARKSQRTLPGRGSKIGKKGLINYKSPPSARGLSAAIQADYTVGNAMSLSLTPFLRSVCKRSNLTARKALERLLLVWAREVTFSLRVEIQRLEFYADLPTLMCGALSPILTERGSSLSSSVCQFREQQPVAR